MHKAMLKSIVEEKWLQAKAVVGFFPAASNDDDVILFTDESRIAATGNLAPPAPAKHESTGQAELLPCPTLSRLLNPASPTISAPLR